VNLFNYSAIIMNASKNNDLGNLNSAGAYSKNDVIINCALNVPLLSGVGRHIEDPFASFTFHGILMQSRCLRPSCWICRAASLHC